MIDGMLPFVREILSRLLDQYEQPNRQRVVRVRLYEDAGYASEARGDVNVALGQLAELGVLRLHWHKWEEGNWLDAIDLVPERAATAYELLGRIPRLDRIGRLRRMLELQAPQADWHIAFVRYALARLNADRPAAPLDLDDHDMNADLLTALDALAQLRAPILERVFSVQTFRDSKRFEALRPKVLAVLRQHDPSADAFTGDDDALLREHFLERVPEYVPISGRLLLDVGPTTLDLAPFAPSVALPASLLRGVAVRCCDARILVTVENLTSFSEIASRRPADWILVYTGGFASPTVMDLLKSVRNTARGIRFCHWGDMDAGGLRILAHLRTHLGAVEVLAMDCSTLRAYSSFTQPISSGDRLALQHLRQSAVLADCIELIDALLEGGQKLEQEAVPVDDVLGSR
jgi:hypothetical protein